MNKKIVFSLSLILVALCQSHATELLVNGNFETGTFAGWTVVDQAGGSGSFYIDTPGTTTPVSSLPTAPNGSGGSYYAVSDQSNPGTHVLLQTFVVAPSTTSLSLSFQMFVNNWATTTPIVNPAGLDYTASPNQHGRVDILTGSATPFDTGAGVVQNLYLGSDPFGTNPNPYTNYGFDLSSLAPGTYQLRFAEVDNLGPFNLGVDNVSLNGNGAVPDTGSSLVLMGMAAATLFITTPLSRRTRKAVV